LLPFGTWNDSLLVVHFSSSRCRCENPGQDRCPLQIEVLSPESLKGFIDFVDGSVNTPVGDLSQDLVGQVILANSTVTNSSFSQIPEEGCDELENSEDVKGNILLIERGTCFFQDKIDNAEKAGASAVIVVNREGTGLISMNVVSKIPAVMISFEDGERIRQALVSGQNVTLKMGPNTGTILKNPRADRPIGLGTIPLADIKEGRNLTITPHTSAFKFINQDFAWEPNRGYLWVIGVDEKFQLTRVYDVKSGFDNLTVLKDIENSPFRNPYGIVTRGKDTFFISQPSEGGPFIEVYNVTDLDNIQLAANLTGLENNEFAGFTTNGTTIYANSGPFFSDVAVFDLSDIKSPERVTNFTEIPSSFNNSEATAFFVDKQDKFLWISFASEGIAVYDITGEKRLHPERVTPLIDNNPQISNEFTVGVTDICGDPNDILKAVAVSANDRGDQEFLRFILEKR